MVVRVFDERSRTGCYLVAIFSGPHLLGSWWVDALEELEDAPLGSIRLYLQGTYVGSIYGPATVEFLGGVYEQGKPQRRIELR